MAEQVLLTVGNREWQASLVSTPWELSRGLGGIAELPQNTGMLFDVGIEWYIQVTTEPMLFSIDIAFLSDELVVTELYPSVAPGHLVVSVNPARYFLEVNAGELSGTEPGDMVSVSYLSTEQAPLVIDSELISIMTLTGFLVIGGFVAVLTKDFVSGTG